MGGYLLTIIKTGVISGAQDAIVAQMIGGINNCILIGHQTSFTGKNTHQQLELIIYWELT